MLKYIMPSIKHRSINDISDLRVQMAINQHKKFESLTKKQKEKIKNDIITLVNTFLSEIGIGINEEFNNEVKCNAERNLRKISYSSIKENSGIACKDDIVWIKLNKNGCISVVGVACDIFFTQKAKDETSSGKINQCLRNYFKNNEIDWDETKVLVFPLINIENLNYNRSDIESGIGNYLIANEIPILDYYSHNY